MNQYLYLILNIFTIAFPLYGSFDSRFGIKESWKAYIYSILISTTIFVIWDFVFTDLSIWDFNPEYILGVHIYNLPIEEILFFITTFYAILFLYQVCKYFFNVNISSNIFNVLGVIFILFLGILAYFFSEKTYTSVNFIFAICITIIHFILFKFKHLSTFVVSYLITLIPFLIFNGVLTSVPVVRYNSAFNLGIRIGTIPIEDSIYCYSMLLLCISIYEYLKPQFKKF